MVEIQVFAYPGPDTGGAAAPALRPGYEPRYHAYMVRVLHLLGQARQAGHDPTVKELDYYGLWEAGHGWTPPSR